MNQRPKIVQRILLVSLLLSSAAQGAVIRVASISPLSGPRATLGIEVKRGAEMAVDERLNEFRAKGQVLSFFSLDDLSNPTRATFVARNLQSDKRILGVVGPQASGVTSYLANTIKDSPVAIVNPTSTSDALTQSGYGFFNRLVAPDSAQAAAIAQYLAQTVKPAKVVVLSDETTYGNNLALTIQRYLKRDSVKIASYQGVSADDDLPKVVQTISTVKPDAIIYAGTDVQAIPVIKAIRTAQIATPIIGGDGLYSPALTEGLKDAASGVVFSSTFAPPSLLPGALGFMKRYKAKYGAEPNGRALYAYDAMNVLLDAIIANVKPGGAAPTREEVIKSVREYVSKPCPLSAREACRTMTGPVKFTSTGERQQSNVYMMRVKSDLNLELISQQVVQASSLKP